MAKFPRIPKLTKNRRQELLLTFCEALTEIRNREEAAQFLTDLLGPQELEMLAKRLEIARALVDGYTYQAIQKDLKVSFTTIARVNAWLTLSGEGFRLIIKRIKKKGKKIYEHTLEEKYSPFSWYNFKRRYSSYFLPELLIEEWFKLSDERGRKKLVTILDSIDSKPELFEAVGERFKEDFQKVRKRVYRPQVEPTKKK